MTSDERCTVFSAGLYSIGGQDCTPFSPEIPQNAQTRGQTRTLDSSQRDVPVYVVFMQGVPVGWGHFEVILGASLGHFEPCAGCALVPVLLQAHAGAQETLRRGAGACQGTNLTKMWPNLEYIWKKSPMSRVGEGVV